MIFSYIQGDYWLNSQVGTWTNGMDIDTYGVLWHRIDEEEWAQLLLMMINNDITLVCACTDDIASY